jgi:pSer/pThr/pTyr-binding forkhead associated (FHA) protein/Mg-chelatase subunit ChlD
MFYRHLLIILLMAGLTVPVWAEPDQEASAEQDPAATVVEAIEEELTPQAEEDVTEENLVEEIDAEIEIAVETEVTEPSGNSASNLIKDVVLVLDNSGSMKKNDPQFLTKHAVTEFINNLDESTRVSIIIFDQDVRTVVPLTEISSSSRQYLLDSLSQINYRGLYTNSPAAIESAIYDLKNNGREEARKVIVFMTDGIVDIGNADRDLEKTKWLKEDLSADAADAGIRIFGIAFTENADFELIQSLAQKTDGEYYRALLADDLQKVFSKLNTLINEPDKPEEITKPEIIIIEKIVERVVESAQAPETIIIKVPAAQPQLADESERKRSMLILVALAVLILAVIAMVLMLLRGSKSKSRDDGTAQEAYLNDIHGVTGQASFALGNKPTMMGRVAGKDTEYLNYFVIPETTIGRRHSLIEYKDFSYWIIDQGSINGTFVNDRPVTSEVRLKHGDIVRLHKVEFEFVMPEMADSGMTVISNTVIASQGTPNSGAATLMPGSPAQATSPDDIDLPDPDFDITGTVNEDEKDTIIRGSVPDADDVAESDDDTIMLDDNDGDDVMEGYDDDDDATIRPD